MAHAPKKPPSNEHDKALTGPNAAEGGDNHRFAAGASKSAPRGGDGSRSRAHGSRSQQGMHDLDAGADMTHQDAGSSGHGQSSSSGMHGRGSRASGRERGAHPGRSDGAGMRSRSAGSAAGAERVGDVMTRDVCLANPDQTIREAAAMMADADVGSLPVGENDRLVGMITDRDIVLRAVAEGRDSNTSVREVMTDRIQYCYEDESVDEVARNMADLGVRRLPVVNRDKRLVGIVALSNITHCGDSKAKDVFLDSVATPH